MNHRRRNDSEQLRFVDLFCVAGLFGDRYRWNAKLFLQRSNICYGKLLIVISFLIHFWYAPSWYHSKPLNFYCWFNNDFKISSTREVEWKVMKKLKIVSFMASIDDFCIKMQAIGNRTSSCGAQQCAELRRNSHRQKSSLKWIWARLSFFPMIISRNHQKISFSLPTHDDEYAHVKQPNVRSRTRLWLV